MNNVTDKDEILECLYKLYRECKELDMWLDTVSIDGYTMPTFPWDRSTISH
jgi:hypothetical protein